MESLVLAPLNSLESHLNSLIASLTQTNTFTNAPQIAKELVSDDDNLTSALNLLQRHQQNYARILSLQGEVAGLQDQLKDTIRRCVALRQDIGQVHPLILENTDSDDDDEAEADTDAKVSEIDYHTLLSFAARMGKHNAAAAREAEAESVRRKVAARSRDAPAIANGVHDSTTQRTENATAETEAELERIDNSVAQTRAQMGMAFPDANILRVGALGQLQLFQERQAHLSSGDAEIQAAVDREVERMVRESEDVAPVAENESMQEDGLEEGNWMSPEITRATIPGAAGQSISAVQRQASTSQQRPRQTVPAAQAPRRKVDLDFPSSDDEDDD